MRDQIYTNGTYLSNNPGWGERDAFYKTDFIEYLLKKNNICPTSVIDVGCGTGGALRNLQTRFPGIQELKGYDISADAINIARQKATPGIHFFNADILKEKDTYAELVLVLDVFEHVRDFYSMLEQLKKHGGHFIFHIPLDLCCRSLLKPHILFQQRESVGHIHYFSKDMVIWMLEDSGYRIIDWQYSKSAIDRFAPTSPKQWIKKTLRKISFSIHRELSVNLWGGFSMMILAK